MGVRARLSQKKLWGKAVHGGFIFNFWGQTGALVLIKINFDGFLLSIFYHKDLLMEKLLNITSAEF